MSAPWAAIYALAAGATDAGSLAGSAGVVFVFATVVVTGAVVVGGSAVLAGALLFEPHPATKPAKATTPKPSARLCADCDQRLSMREIACIPLTERWYPGSSNRVNDGQLSLNA